jgi:hypothetical protein
LELTLPEYLNILFKNPYYDTQGHGHSYLTITKQGAVLGTAFADGINDWDQGSVTVTTHLAKGEQVYVQPHSGTAAIRGSGPVTDAGVHTTVFSGFLVQAD